MPALPFLLFLCFLYFLECAHTTFIRDRKLNSEFLPLSAPCVLAGEEGSPPPPLLWNHPHHCLRPNSWVSWLFPLQIGSCFLVQSNKRNPLPSVILPLRFPPFPTQFLQGTLRLPPPSHPLLPGPGGPGPWELQLWPAPAASSRPDLSVAFDAHLRLVFYKMSSQWRFPPTCPWWERSPVLSPWSLPPAPDLEAQCLTGHHPADSVPSGFGSLPLTCAPVPSTSQVTNPASRFPGSSPELSTGHKCLL